ncbi:hypothetical protein ACNAN0_03870 [Agrilactobacillus fermenti]|uniref:hypothetical protein n=1 Tax=Agrilactobacillus fermenti TaxID=2586909 RepID=UPI003A5BA169
MIQGAFNRLGNVLPTLWLDKITIKGVRRIKNGPFTDTEDVTVVENEPGKISRKALKPSQQSYFGTDNYDVVLYIRTGIKIPPGADIYVTDVNGQITKYKQAGRGYTGYVSHQEVALIRDEKAKEVADYGLGHD